MKTWKLATGAFIIGCTALLLSPLTATALNPKLPDNGQAALSSLDQPVHHEMLAAGTALAADARQSAAATPPGPEAAPEPLQAGQRPNTPEPDTQKAETSLMQQHPEPSSGDDAGTPALEQQIKQWATSLSKEPGFEAWSAATWSVYPLGPGTHSWMILLQGNGQEIGYMIIASTKEHTYKLMEYGLGPNPLFSMNTLYQSLVQRALIPDTIPYESFAQEPSMKLTRWYILPLQAVWEVQQGTTTLYLDAKTGEELPDIGSWLTGTKEIQQVLSQYPLSSGVISESQTRADFDPFMKTTWLTETPLAQLTFAQWKSTAAPELHFTYLGKLFGGRALYPLAVSGYHLWDTDCSFLRLEHEGSRFVPYMDALLAGELFSGS